MTHVPCPDKTGLLVWPVYIKKKKKKKNHVPTLFSELRRRFTSKVDYQGVLFSILGIDRLRTGKLTQIFTFEATSGYKQ